MKADGKISLDNVYAELLDYLNLMENVSRVYNHITCGKMSKTNYRAHDVIIQSDECVEDMTRREVVDVLERLEAGETVEELKQEYQPDCTTIDP